MHSYPEFIRYIFIFTVFTINASFASEIIITNDFSVIEKEAHTLDSDSLLLFDVDATLIVPNDALLKPQWKDLFEQLTAGSTDRDLFREIRMKAPHSLVDERSIGLVQSLQQNEIPVVAFTAAPSIVRGVEEPGVWRVDELLRYGFDFSPAFPDSNFVVLPKKATQQHFPLFKSGVLYSSFHSKGDILIAFLQQIALKPSIVIFVDDELRHVQSVVASLDQYGIPCIGIHYTAANEVYCDLDEEHARFQVNYFVEHGVWLSDNESKQALENAARGIDEVLNYWFESEKDLESKNKLWFGQNQAVDQEIHARFEPLVVAASKNELASWANSPRGRLALIILLDQFPRNIYRNTPQAFAYDRLGQKLALEGIEKGEDAGLAPLQRVFFYLPLEHAECLPLQQLSVAKFSELLLQVPEDQKADFKSYLEYAESHYRTIEQFGRFPHRNAILGRPSTPEEIDYLNRLDP